MPFKSKAQRRKFFAMAGRGEISKKTLHEFQRATGKRKLPERVKKKKKHNPPVKGNFLGGTGEKSDKIAW